MAKTFETIEKVRREREYEGAVDGLTIAGNEFLAAGARLNHQTRKSSRDASGRLQRALDDLRAGDLRDAETVDATNELNGHIQNIATGFAVDSEELKKTLARLHVARS